VEPPRPPSRPLAAGEQVIRTGLGGLASLGGATSALETIRFAGANHLCVDLDYSNEQGRTSTRTIEPYSLRRTQEGHVLLHADHADDGIHRTYRVDRILGARVTSRAFTPRFAIELAPSGPQAIAPFASARMTTRHRPAPSRRRRAGTGITYIYECSWCRKHFSRQIQHSKLNPHKNKTGWPCPGRTGWLVDTRH
jgi:hypothetical protein